VAEAVAQSVPYDPAMREAYAWWTGQFLDGLRAKVADIPDDAENKRTIVVMPPRLEVRYRKRMRSSTLRFPRH
jgi:hypothetical protein